MCISPEQLLRQVRAVRRFAGVHVTFDDGFRSIRAILPRLQQFDIPITLFICSGYADRGGAPLLIPELETDDPEDLEQLRTMSWEELRGLGGDRIAIGSHTISHAHLTRLDDSALARELRESKQRIEDELGRACRLFAYPYGEHDERVRAAVRAAGYEHAYALWWRRGDSFATPRVDLYRRDTLLGVLAKTRPFRAGPQAPLQPAATSAETGVRTP